MSALYIVAGIIHLTNPDFYLRIIPLWLPWHILLVFISGVIEIMLGIMLFLRTTRVLSAWLIIIMLSVFLFTIHTPMVIDYYQTQNPLTWVAIIRLPLQFVLIWWAYLCTKN